MKQEMARTKAKTTLKHLAVVEALFDPASILVNSGNRVVPIASGTNLTISIKIQAMENIATASEV